MAVKERESEQVDYLLEITPAHLYVSGEMYRSQMNQGGGAGSRLPPKSKKMTVIIGAGEEREVRMGNQVKLLFSVCLCQPTKDVSNLKRLCDASDEQAQG